jgi:RNA polymerase sigma-70 factor (ECF subfamily)
VLPAELAVLVARANTGDAGARHELLTELYAAVRKHVYLLVGAGPVADDAVQETMIAIHHGLPSFRGDSSPRTWALTIATRTTYRLRRKERRYVPVEEPGDAALFDLAPGAAAELALLQRALATLSAKKRAAFVLMAICELTAEEAGRALGTFANTAASRYRHARAELEAYLSRAGVDESTGLPATKKVGHD